MKHIIFVKTIKTEEDVKLIDEALEFVGVKYNISLNSSTVTVEGSNDLIHRTKQAISQAGFIIQ